MAKRLFSGIQPSGNLHIGNYLGAIKQWETMQNEYETLLCIVDLHAITVPQEPEELRRRTLELAKIYLAAGIDPEKCILFVQSHVQEHAELAWILNTIAKNGDLTKMTQFKSKSGLDFDQVEAALKAGLVDAAYESSESVGKTKDDFRILAMKTGGQIVDIFERMKADFNAVGTGLFSYPVLMAADILLYDTAVVPVGEDQVQHIELTRTLAKRFNDRFGEVFALPQPKITKEGARIMGLDDPSKKMSKSASSEYNYIALSDEASAVKRKIKKAVTDSGSTIVYSDEKPALKNLINIYSLLSGKPVGNIEKEYQGRGYAEFKEGLAAVVISFLEPFQKRMAEFDEVQVEEILVRGAKKARGLAEAKMKQVKEKIGLVSQR